MSGTTIAVDAMGGDNAPQAIIAGAVDAVRMYGVSVILTGDRGQLEPLVPTDVDIQIHHAPEVIGMFESPAKAVRQKKESSVVQAALLVKNGKANAMVSAGSTGAAMAASVFNIGRIGGVERPAIGILMPTIRSSCLIVDGGANHDCRPNHLAQFGQMGSIFAREVLGIPEPKVGLLNIGEEASKGTEVVQKAYQELAALPIHFAGNIEGRDITTGEVDVVVCDGFVGNILLKFAEGLGSTLFQMIKEEMARSWVHKLGALLARPGFRAVKRRVDYTEYGGAPLLGLKGVSIISHGSSNAKAVRNAIRVASEAAGSGFVTKIAQSMVGE